MPSKTVISKIVGIMIAAAIVAATFIGASYVSERVEGVVNRPVGIAGDAAVAINAPTECKVGELVVLDVSESEAASFIWQVVPETNNFLVIDGGQRAVFSSQVGGDYLFIVAVAKGDSVDVKTHVITVAGKPAGPSKPPRVDIRSQVPGWAASVMSPTKRDDAVKLAQSFSSVAAIANSSMEVADLIQATQRSNRDALGGRLDDWKPFLASLQDSLQQMSEAGQLPDAASHIVVWRSIGEALRDYSKGLQPPASAHRTGVKVRRQ